MKAEPRITGLTEFEELEALYHSAVSARSKHGPTAGEILSDLRRKFAPETWRYTGTVLLRFSSGESPAVYREYHHPSGARRLLRSPGDQAEREEDL